MYKHQNSQGSGSFSWVFQRVTGLILVVVMVGHYILMHYTPESGHTYDAVLARMQSNWYRVLDLTFLVLGMYHGLNGVWGIFRDYKLKPWQTITIMSLLIVLGLAFTLWGVKTILDIPYVQTSTSELLVKLAVPLNNFFQSKRRKQMEKINEIKAMLDDMGKDLEKFYSKGQNSAGTRLRKSLNEVRKKCQEMRNEIQTIRQDRKTSAPAS